MRKEIFARRKNYKLFGMKILGIIYGLARTIRVERYRAIQMVQGNRQRVRTSGFASNPSAVNNS